MAEPTETEERPPQTQEDSRAPRLSERDLRWQQRLGQLLTGGRLRTQFAEQWMRDRLPLAAFAGRGAPELDPGSLDGREPVNLSRHPALDSFPSWTPDGRGVTFVSNRDGACEVYTQVVAP